MLSYVSYWCGALFIFHLAVVLPMPADSVRTPPADFWPGGGVGGSSCTTTRALKTNKSWQMDTISTTRFYYQRCNSQIPERKSAPHAPKQMTFYLVVPQLGYMRSSSPSLMQSRGPSIHAHSLSWQRHHPRLNGCSDTQRRRQL